MPDKQKRHGRAAFGEIALFIFGFAIMVASIIGADYLEKSGLVAPDVAFVIKQFTTYISRLGLVMLSVWIFSRIGFFHLVSRNFEASFEEGWNEMPKAESTRWRIIILLTLFLCATLLMLA